MKTLPLSEVKMKLSQLIDEISSQDEQVTITRNGRPAAVLISRELQFKSSQGRHGIVQILTHLAGPFTPGSTEATRASGYGR